MCIASYSQYQCERNIKTNRHKCLYIIRVLFWFFVCVYSRCNAECLYSIRTEWILNTNLSSQWTSLDRRAKWDDVSSQSDSIYVNYKLELILLKFCLRWYSDTHRPIVWHSKGYFILKPQITNHNRKSNCTECSTWIDFWPKSICLDALLVAFLSINFYAKKRNDPFSNPIKQQFFYQLQ